MTIHGCHITPLSSAACRDIVARAAQDHTEIEVDATLALAHCVDGISWGRADSGSWSFSAAAFPGECPIVTAANILEIRFFGDRSETLIWHRDGELHGRVLADCADGDVGPLDVPRVVNGDRVLRATTRGFTMIGDGAGSAHAVPMACSAHDFATRPWPLRLLVRHYFETDEETGIARIAASRLVHLILQREAS